MLLNILSDNMLVAVPIKFKKCNSCLFKKQFDVWLFIFSRISIFKKYQKKLLIPELKKYRLKK